MKRGDGKGVFAFDKEGGYLPLARGRKRKQGEKGEPRCCVYCMFV